MKLCFKLAFTAVALWLVYNKVDFTALERIWGKANPWFFIPAVACFIASQVISSFRLLVFFKNTGLPITALFNIGLYLQGMFYNIFLPGGIGGDGYKIVVLGKRFKEKPKTLFIPVLLDRISGAWAICFFIIVFGLMVKAAPDFVNWAIIIFVAATALYYIIIRKYFSKHASRFVTAHLLALLVQAFQCLCVFFILLSLGHTGYKPPYLFIFLLSAFATLFPLTIGGLGAREIVIIWAAAALSLDKDISASVSLCFYIISALVSLFGAVLVFSKNAGKTFRTAASG
ncbi:lysylphosphatidylglycerol synthase transmembrane domain-containing protein [Parafilimonas sp.]|uniref:lysylphosphatidylglycerol synthase transmembrane domain-containing protein n=1 Tax=Parafilimonas sp. TaxID=1969739 RepID=UPI0039E3140C